MSAKQTARKYLKMMTPGTKAANILKALIAGRQITHLDCMVIFKATSGPQRINEMRRDGVPIKTQWRRGFDSRYKVYYL